MNGVRWSMGDASLHGMGTSLVPCQDFGCYPCPWTKLLPMCPDRTVSLANRPFERSGMSAQPEAEPASAGRSAPLRWTATLCGDLGAELLSPMPLSDSEHNEA